MRDFLDVLAESAEKTVENGYYKIKGVQRRNGESGLSLKKSIAKCSRNPVVAEFKRSSPSRKIAVGREIDALDAVSAMQRGGASGISVITEPRHFGGSLFDFRLIRENVAAPLLMKDFIVAFSQIEAAGRVGANAVLLIQALFDRGYCEGGLDEFIEYAHSLGAEVLLETHTADEFQRASASSADLIGINNRDLRTLATDLDTTPSILCKLDKGSRLVVSESGIESPQHIRFLRSAGANAFLVGTAVMLSTDIEAKVRELVGA